MMSRRRLITGAAGASLGVAVAGSIGGGPSAHAATEPTAADVGYCTDMATHHVQALAMCQRVLGRDTGGPVQAAAAEVLQNQAIEVGQMRAWLTDWGESTVPPTTVMAWMGAGNGDGIALADMPGYATPAELQQLSLTSGRERGRMWLELMRAHHVGGVMMATMATNMASSVKVVRLASTQAATQQWEIDQYDLLLTGEYA